MHYRSREKLDRNHISTNKKQDIWKRPYTNKQTDKSSVGLQIPDFFLT